MLAKPACTCTNSRFYGDIWDCFGLEHHPSGARVPWEGCRRGAFPILALNYSFSITGMAKCHRRLSRALPSVSNGPSGFPRAISSRAAFFNASTSRLSSLETESRAVASLRRPTSISTGCLLKLAVISAWKLEKIAEIRAPPFLRSAAA